MRVRVFVCLLCLVPVTTGTATAADFYLSAAGSDSNAGTSALAPWQSLARLNGIALAAGDRVLLRGGDRFPGTLSLDAGDRGTVSQPIAIASYGSGRATVASGAAAGISVYNTAGVSISNINVAGGGGAASGIVFYVDLGGDVRLPGIRIDGVDVSGYGRDGIEIGAWNGHSGFSDVRVTNAVLHGNARTGLFVYAQSPNTHQQIYVGHVRAYDNPGIPGSASNSGSGIVIASADGATVERSVAHDNGRLCAAAGGPVGIWAYDSRRVTIQHNESFANHTAAGWDGGGFDLDQNVSDSLVQYNYSHDNDGAGYLLAQSLATDTHANNVVRFNVSQNDGRANSYAGIEVWGRVTAAEIYNNTVYMSPALSGAPRPVRVWNAGVTDRVVSAVHFRNNLFVTAHLPVVEVTAAALAGAVDLRFQQNDYFDGSTNPVFDWGGSAYAGLAAWRSTGQETIGSAASGLALDPQLTAAGGGPTYNDADQLAALDAYRQGPASPLIDAGLDLAAAFGIAPGTMDYFGGALGVGRGFDVGAAEAAAPVGVDEVLMLASAARVWGIWRPVSDGTAAGGVRLWHPDQGSAKLAAALAAPQNYFELTFTADAGKPYRLWMRGLAENNLWCNDSVFVQFSDAVDQSTGQPLFRIGSTSATPVNLEDDSGAGVSGWGWQDNGWGSGVLGPTIAFASAGLHTIRVQTREDGFSIDQIVLSSRRYLTTAPGTLKNDTTRLTAAATAPAEVVIHAAALPAAALHGDWTLAADPTAAEGFALVNPDRGSAKVAGALAAPSAFVDVPFTAQAGVPYHVWLRMRAANDSYANDSVYIQLSDAVSDDASAQPVARIGTTAGDPIVLQDYANAPIAGWGWNDNGWAVVGSPYVFSQTGAHTLRIQQREDGISIDQIVISPAKYLAVAPGAASHDATIVPGGG